MAISGEQKLKSTLQLLATEHGIVGVKSGTEAEDMSFEEIAMMNRISSGIVPHTVKIGGPEARNDIRELVRLNVDGLIAPMIESPYALNLFVETIQEIVPPEKLARISLGINLETLQGYANLQAILQASQFRYINKVTAARTDLSRSLGMEQESERVFQICQEIVSYTRKKGVLTSTGGSLQKNNIRTIMERIQPDTINSRHMVLDCGKIQPDPETSLQKALQFELEFYNEIERSGLSTKSYDQRIGLLETRMEQVQP